jgi:hypothetical protein
MKLVARLERIASEKGDLEIAMIGESKILGSAGCQPAVAGSLPATSGDVWHC